MVSSSQYTSLNSPEQPTEGVEPSDIDFASNSSHHANRGTTLNNDNDTENILDSDSSSLDSNSSTDSEWSQDEEDGNGDTISMDSNIIVSPSIQSGFQGSSNSTGLTQRQQRRLARQERRRNRHMRRQQRQLEAITGSRWRRFVRSAHQVLRRPSFLLLLVFLSIAIFGVMYSMRGLLLEPSSQGPEIIPQAAVITVKGSNVTIPARPAAFGPPFPSEPPHDDDDDEGKNTENTKDMQKSVGTKLRLLKRYMFPNIPEPVVPSAKEGSVFKRYFGQFSFLDFGLNEDLDVDEENKDNLLDTGVDVPPVAAIDSDGVYYESNENIAMTDDQSWIEYFLQSYTGNFSDIATGGFTRKLAVVNSLACKSDENRQDLSGKIALIERGVCSFYEKVLVAQEWGADAVIVGDNIYRHGLITMYSTATPDLTNISSVFVSKSSFDFLKTVTTEVTITSIDLTTPVMGPILFLLISPLCSLSVIYGMLLFHRQYKKVQERAPKWAVDNLPRRVWRDPLVNGHNNSINNGNNTVAVESSSNNVTSEGDRNTNSETLSLDKQTVPDRGAINSALESQAGDLVLQDEEIYPSIEETEECENEPLLSGTKNGTLLSSSEGSLSTASESTGFLKAGKSISTASSPSASSSSIDGNHNNSQSQSESKPEQVCNSETLANTNDNQSSTLMGSNETSIGGNSNVVEESSLPAPEKIWVSSGECIICLDEYEDGVSIVIRLPCGHEFHEECIKRWLLSRKRTCPICKMDVLLNQPTTWKSRRPFRWFFRQEES